MFIGPSGWPLFLLGPAQYAYGVGTNEHVSPVP
jgi:hypothetical protein